MILESTRDQQKGVIRFCLEIKETEIVTMKLSKFDRELIFECDPIGSISDKLSALEVMARKIEETLVKK